MGRGRRGHSSKHGVVFLISVETGDIPVNNGIEMHLIARLIMKGRQVQWSAKLVLTCFFGQLPQETWDTQFPLEMVTVHAMVKFEMHVLICTVTHIMLSKKSVWDTQNEFWLPGIQMQEEGSEAAQTENENNEKSWYMYAEET